MNQQFHVDNTFPVKCNISELKTPEIFLDEMIAQLTRRGAKSYMLICKSLFPCCSFRMLLWHGSRLTNWVGILSQGLRIAPPEAPVTGYMVRTVKSVVDY